MLTKVVAISLLLSMTAIANAAVVEKVRSNHALIRLDDLAVQVGDELSIIKPSGIIRLRVTKVGHVKCAADMINGVAQPGDTIYRSDDPQVQLAASTTKSKMKKFKDRKGLLVKLGYDSTSTYEFEDKNTNYGKSTVTTNAATLFAIGYQEVKKDKFGWDISLTSETKRKTKSFTNSSGLLNPPAGFFDHTMAGLEVNANYGFDFLDSLSYVFGGLGKYSFSFSDSNNNGSLVGIELGVGGFFLGNFNYDILYRGLTGKSGLGDVTAGGLIIRFGYLFEF